MSDSVFGDEKLKSLRSVQTTDFLIETEYVKWNYDIHYTPVKISYYDVSNHNFLSKLSNFIKTELNKNKDYSSLLPLSIYLSALHVSDCQSISTSYNLKKFLHSDSMKSFIEDIDKTEEETIKTALQYDETKKEEKPVFEMGDQINNDLLCKFISFASLTLLAASFRNTETLKEVFNDSIYKIFNRFYNTQIDKIFQDGISDELISRLRDYFSSGSKFIKSITKLLIEYESSTSKTYSMSGILYFCYLQKTQFTGMHIPKMICLTSDIYKVEVSEIFVELYITETHEVIDEMILGIKSCKNKIVWRYANLFDPLSLNYLKTKSNKLLTYILASLVYSSGDSAWQTFAIKDINIDEESKKLAKTIVKLLKGKWRKLRVIQFLPGSIFENLKKDDLGDDELSQIGEFEDDLLSDEC